jgi:hypothetical protein
VADLCPWSNLLYSAISTRNIPDPNSPKSWFQYCKTFIPTYKFDVANSYQFNTNLLTIPKDIFHILTLLGITWLSEKTNQRALVGIAQPLWTLPCIIALVAWPGLVKDKWGTFALITTLLSYPYCHAINVGWSSTNSNNVGSRSVSAAFYNSKFDFQPTVKTYTHMNSSVCSTRWHYICKYLPQ